MQLQADERSDAGDRRQPRRSCLPVASSAAAARDRPIAGDQPDARPIGRDAPGRPAAPDLDAPFGRLVQQPLIQTPTREAPGRERQAVRWRSLSRTRPSPARSARHPRSPATDRARSSSAAASPLRNSPQTLSCGPGSRSNSTTCWPASASSVAAAAPARPPPATATSQLMRGDGAKAHRLGRQSGAEGERAARPAGPRPASSRASTNMTVAELMLP